MSHTLTEVDSYSATVTVPDSGDARTAASVTTFAQNLADRTKFLNARRVQPGHLAWDGRYRIPGYADNLIYIAPIQSIVINGKVLSSSVELTADATGVTNNSWAYVYAYDNSGALEVTISSTAPDTALVYMTGDNTRRYLCPVRRTTGANLPGRGRAGRFKYREVGASLLGALIGNNASTFTTLGLSTWLPPHAQIGALDIQVLATSADATATLRTNGTADPGFSLFTAGVASGVSTERMYLDLETDSSQQIEHKVNAAGGSPTLSINVIGFQE